MAFYREEEKGLSRDYAITQILDCFTSERSLVHVVKTKQFGEALFLDNELQFTARDEYIYHEALVHPVLSFAEKPQRICILGGGDGCAAREVLKWEGVDEIDIVDWDKDVLQLFSHKYSSLNSLSLTSPKVNLLCQDVLTFTAEETYDVVIVDLLDPSYEDKTSSIVWPYLIAKLPSLLKPTGSAVLNVGGITPWDTTDAEWILMLLSNAFKTNTTHSLQAYKTFVPSFAADWCFFLLSPSDATVNPTCFSNKPSLRYLDENAWLLATTWTKDYGTSLPMQPVKLNGYLPPV